MLWGGAVLSQYKRQSNHQQKLALIKELDASIQRWEDSTNNHLHNSAIYKFCESLSGRDLVIIQRNRMITKDLKQLRTLVLHLRTQPI